MKKIIGMIPARMGSKRVPKKNLRLINGQPLIFYIINTILSANMFDDIYLNSESEILERIAEEKGIKFYKRNQFFASDAATNDEFALDFMENIGGDILIQILPTSPFVQPQDIQSFVKTMLEGDYDTLISVEHKQIACMYKDKPINFDRYKINPPSQTMEPIKAYATALMGWKYDNFKMNMKKYGCAYHGGKGKIGFFELRGLSTIDIDREDDFQLASAIIEGRTKSSELIKYYEDDGSKKEHREVDVESILKTDGVITNDLYDSNKESVNLFDIINKMGRDVSWSKRVIDTENNSMTIIAQLPGEGNRLHYHPEWNEWWYIVEGEWEWEIDGDKHVVKAGDIVFMRKNRKHKITAIGDKLAIRMAVSRADAVHVYPEDKAQ